MATVPNKDGFGGTDPHIDEPYGGTPIWGFTWNNPTATWYGHRINITDTGSAADSKAIEVKRNGSSIFSVAKTGIIAALGLALSGVAAIAGGTVTANAPAIDVSQTWNAGGVTFTAIKMNVTDTASASGSLLQDWQVGGVSQARIGKSGGYTSIGSLLTTGGNIGAINDAGRFLLGASSDVVLNRDAANTFAQRNGTNAQASRLYKTYTDGSNYERLSTFISGTTFYILTESAGTGTIRPLSIGVTGFCQALFDGTGMTISNGRLMIGGATSAFPAIKRDGTGISIRLADDSAASFIKHVPVTVASLPAAATAGAGARMVVSDASAPTFGATVAGGGAVVTPVYSDGTNWKVG